MTKREKILAAAVGLLVLLIVTVALVGHLQKESVRRADMLTQAELDVANQDRIILQGKRAAQRLEDYGERSLPADPVLARTLYQDWLLKTAVGMGLSNVNVTPAPSRPIGNVYVQHTFVVSGKADLKKVVELLYAFQERGFLQRIKLLTAKRTPRSKDLDVSLTVESLSLNRAPDRDELQTPPTYHFTKARDEYLASIVNRNLLALANKPPRLGYLGTQTGHPGSSLRFRLRGEDPDDQDRLTYRFEGPPLDGARIDPNSGEIEWTPRELGEYEISVCVSDNGLPSKTDTETVKIAVVEPPPRVEPPKPMGFDAAKQSVVTGITAEGDRRLVWVSVRTEGKLLQLAEGDEVSVGSVQGVVTRIRQREAEIKTKDGDTLVITLGDPLRSEQ